MNKSFKIISQKLRTLKAAFDERHDKKTVAEYKAFVQMMPQLNKGMEFTSTYMVLSYMIHIRYINLIWW